MKGTANPVSEGGTFAYGRIRYAYSPHMEVSMMRSILRYSAFTAINMCLIFRISFSQTEIAHAFSNIFLIVPPQKSNWRAR